jgi:hypothetical protein
VGLHDAAFAWTFAACATSVGASQGSPYGRFRRALDKRNALAALSLAAELRSVNLTDVLELCLLLCEREPCRHERVRGVSLDEGQDVLALVPALRGLRRPAVAHSLAELSTGGSYIRRAKCSPVGDRWALKMNDGDADRPGRRFPSWLHLAVDDGGVKRGQAGR